MKKYKIMEKKNYFFLIKSNFKIYKIKNKSLSNNLKLNIIKEESKSKISNKLLLKIFLLILKYKKK